MDPLCQSLSLSGEVAWPKVVTERVSCRDEPSQSRFARQLPRRGEPLAKAAGPATQVNALHLSTYNQYTFPLCQSLSLSGEVARPKAVTERVSCRDEPSQSRCARQLSRRASPWQGREVSALYRSAGEGDTFRLRQSLSLSGEVARPKAVTERVASRTNPLRLASFASWFPFLSPGGDIFPRPGEVFPLRWSLWQRRQNLRL